MQVKEPEINIGSAFSAAAVAAAGLAFNVSELNPPFLPYGSEVAFLLGAFIFEDVGVTAYGVSRRLSLRNAAVDD